MTSDGKRAAQVCRATVLPGTRCDDESVRSPAAECGVRNLLRRCPEKEESCEPQASLPAVPEEGLSLRRRNVNACHEGRGPPTNAPASWSLDSSPTARRPTRQALIVDTYTRVLAVEVDTPVTIRAGPVMTRSEALSGEIVMDDDEMPPYRSEPAYPPPAVVQYEVLLASASTDPLPPLSRGRESTPPDQHGPTQVIPEHKTDQFPLRVLPMMTPARTPSTGTPRQHDPFGLAQYEAINTASLTHGT